MTREVELYGFVTTERDSRDEKYQKVMSVSFEIEVSWELDIFENLVMSYSVWVERCYRERMKQILTESAVE